MTSSTPTIWQILAKEPDLSRSVNAVLKAVQSEVQVRGMAFYACDADKQDLLLLHGTGDEIESLTGESARSWAAAAHKRKVSIATSSEISTQCSIVFMSLSPASSPVGAILLSCDKERLQKVVTHIGQFTDAFCVAITNHLKIAELTKLRRHAEAQREDLLHRMGRDEMHDDIVGSRHGLSDIMHQVALVAPSDSTALILGQTGSGKEVIARAIHQQSARNDMPFIRVNCGAMPAELMDSELFGHEKGSFTGAGGLRRGWFERANGGTLFLDEVGELPMAAQVRLLRVIQEGTLTRVGGEEELHVNVRIIAATHRNLAELVRKGLFREDLWYRLNVFPLYLPSLSERTGDIPALAHHFSRRASKKLGLPFIPPTAEQINTLMQYDWPGNVREMQVVIERAAILGRGDSLEIRLALGSGMSYVSPVSPALPPAEMSAGLDTMDNIIIGGIKAALKATNGRVEGYFGAARLLDMNPNTLRSKMRKYGINIKKVIN